MSLVQGFDGLIGVLAHDPAKTYGPFVFALVNLAALVWLLRSHEEGQAEENSN
jgi:apolipoprotein N-acyltransferase